MGGVPPRSVIGGCGDSWRLLLAVLAMAHLEESISQPLSLSSDLAWATTAVSLCESHAGS